jgi:hypothetical protein
MLSLKVLSNNNDSQNSYLHSTVLFNQAKMEGPPVPKTMMAWRKHKGNYEAVCDVSLYEKEQANTIN